MYFSKTIVESMNAKSLALIAITTSGVTAWFLYRKYGAHGPYNAEVGSVGFLQRLLLETTRRKVPFIGSFDPLVDVEAKPAPRRNDNGHAVCGRIRDSARVSIQDFARRLGLKVMEISPSARSLPGPHVVQHIAPQDLEHPIGNPTPGDDNLLVTIDTDYYVKDWSEYLGNACHSIHFGFSPVTMAGKDGDADFVVENNMVKYLPGGGNVWTHPVWDWNVHGEFIKVEMKRNFWSSCLNLFGIRRIMIRKVYCARPWVDLPHRILTWTTPSYTCYEFKFARGIMARELKHMVYSDKRKGWNSVIAQGDELVINLARDGETANVSMFKRHYDVLMGVTNPQSVTTRMLKMVSPVGDEYTSEERSLFLQYHAGTVVTKNYTTVLGRPMVMPLYVPIMDGDDVEVSMRAYSNPLVTDCNLAPMIKRWEATSASIDTRVTFVKNHTVPAPVYKVWADEFLKELIPDSIAGTGNPYELEATLEMLNKPSQMAAVRGVMETLEEKHRSGIECFIKNEPTNKPSRIISAFSDVRYLVGLSAYTLSFRDNVLHGLPWFCPGLNPAAIAERVVEYVRELRGVSTHPIEGDFSNFDGTVSPWLQRHVMNAALHRYFGAGDRQQLIRYTDDLVYCPSKSKRFGFRYNSGAGVKSGSPTTCDLNTVLNGFLQFCAVRRTLPQCSAATAFASIGLAFGDDSLFESSYAKAFAKVAKHVGMQLKIEKYQPDQGVTFLARVYVDPDNTTTTIQDPLRTWRKLHLTSRDKLVPIADAAMDRVSGYLVTDSLSPITSHYCRLVSDQMVGKCSSLEKRAARKDRMRDTNYWCNASPDASWPQDIAYEETMWAVTAARTGFSVEQLRSYARSLEGVSLEDMPTLLREDVPYAQTVLPDGTEVGLGPRSQRLMQEQNAITRNPDSAARSDGNASGRGVGGNQTTRKSTNGQRSHGHRRTPSDVGGGDPPSAKRDGLTDGKANGDERAKPAADRKPAGAGKRAPARGGRRVKRRLEGGEGGSAGKQKE